MSLSDAEVKVLEQRQKRHTCNKLQQRCRSQVVRRMSDEKVLLRDDIIIILSHVFHYTNS